MANEISKTKPIYIHKIINNNAIVMFRQEFYETDWPEIEISRNPDVCYKIFLKTFVSLWWVVSNKNDKTKD